MSALPAPHTSNRDLLGEIRAIAERLPAITAVERRWGEIDSYGANWMLARRLGLPRPLEVYQTINWNHGVHDIARISDEPGVLCSVLNYKFPNDGRDRTILVENARAEQLLRAKGYSRATAVGLPFIYERQELDFPRIPRSVLVVGTHSTPWFSLFDGKVNPIDGKSPDLAFPRAAARLKEKFDLVAACIGASDVLLGNWVNAFEHQRIPWLTGAWVHDANALLRMQRIFRSFEYVATNAQGSHIFYALHCGCKVFWYGDDSDVNFRQVFKLDRRPGREKELEIADQVRRGAENFRQLYPFLFCAPEEAVANEAAGGAVIGEPHRRPPEEIAALLGWNLRRTRVGGWAPVDETDFSTVAALQAEFRLALKTADTDAMGRLLAALDKRSASPRNGFLALGKVLAARQRTTEARTAAAAELERFPDNAEARKMVAELADSHGAQTLVRESEPDPVRVVFVAHGPGQINGPNIWLTRLLPALRQRGFAPRLLMFMNREASCPIVDKLRAAGIRCDLLPIAHTEDMMRAILAHLRENPCDVFVPNLSVPAYFASSILKAAGIATVGVMHSDDDFYRDLTDEFVAGQKGRHLDAVVAVSGFLHAALSALDHGPTKVVKAPCGAPMPPTTTRFSCKPFRFVYVGRLVEEQKRASDMVRAMIAVLERNADAEFCICGDGSARPAVQTLIKTSRVHGRIKLFGNVGADQVQALLQQSQALVLLSDYEGIPIALLEAMGTGVVPLCLNIRSGMSDVIRNGENGFLVDDRGDSFLAAAERLMRDAGLWARCSAAARTTVQNEYSVEANAEIWAELIQDLSVRRQGARAVIDVPAEFDLPPVRSNPKGMAREDRRKPKSRPVVPGDVPVGDLPVVLVRSHEFNYSETFVEDHVNHLTKHLTLLYGYPFPRFLKGGRSVVSAACEQKLQAFTRGGGTLTRELWEDYTADLAVFLKTCGARAALLESGLMASFVHEACERAALPYVVHFHGVDAFGRELLARWSGHYRKFFQRAASLAVVSRAMHAQLVKLGAPVNRVQLAPYGVAIDLPAQANPAQAGPRFVAVGRFVEKKAPHLTLQAFAAVHREIPEARLTMIGDGVLLKPCQQWAAEHGLDGAVTFAGVQSRADVSRLMAASGIFVQHSITASTGDSEGLPLAVLEAGAHGLPVVSTRHAGIPDAVREGVDGFLVDEKDVGAMAAAMLRLARDPALAAKLGASFRGRVEARYSRRRSLERLHALLVAAAEGRSAAGLGEPLEDTSAAAGASSGPLVTEVEDAPAPVAAPPAEPPVPQDARGRIALDRNACDAYLELAAELAKQGALAEAYCAAGEAHRLAGDATHPRELLASLEEQGALGEPAVETYRRRAGWVPRRKSTHPRRILVVTNLLPPQEMGGYGRTMWEFSHELAARGHTVRVLTADMPHLLRKPSPEHAQFETQVRRVLRLCGDWKDGAAVTEPDLEKRRQAVKFNHQKILSFAKEFRPDVVMAGNLDFVGHFFMQELLDARIPVVHRLGNARPGYEAQHSPKSPLYCVAGGSEWVNERIRANGYNAGRFAVVPPGSPLTEYFRAFPPQRARLEIAFAGLLMPYKGAHVLVDALARLHRAGIAFRCTLAGDSTDPGYVEKLRAFARAQGFAERLQFPGFLSKSELAALYARSNVLVFPTLVDEVFGKTQIEAMAAGLLVISTGSGGAREIIRDGVTGLLVKSDDAGALAEALARVQRDPARAEKIASAGQADAFRFTTAASVDRLEAVFQELIAPARRAAPRPTEYAA